MTDIPQVPNTAALAELLTRAFMDEKDLRRFCRDALEFRPVLDLVSVGAGLQDHVDLLIRYCETRLLFDELLEGVKRANPRQYARFLPMLGFCPEGHLWGEWEHVVPDSCNAVRACTRCGRNKEQVVHTWSEWEYLTPSSCNAVRACTRCGCSEERVAHIWGEWRHEESPSSWVRICIRCGITEVKSTVSPEP